MQSASVLEVLRLRTRSQHQELDRSACLARLARADVDMPSYATAMHCYWRCYVRLEGLLELVTNSTVHQYRSPLLEGVAPYRSRLSAIECEIAGLENAELQNIEIEIAQAPDSEFSDSLFKGLDSLARKFPAEFELGCRYVLDGSSVGATVIYRNLLMSTKGQDWFKGDFWHVLADVAKDWRGLRDRLQECVPASPPSRVNLDPVVETASLCFSLFSVEFDRERRS